MGTPNDEEPAANRCGATTWVMFELDRVQCVCQRPPGHEVPHDDRGTKWGLSPTSDTQTERRVCSADGKDACPRHTPDCPPGCAVVPPAIQTAIGEEVTNPDDGLPVVTGTLRDRFTQTFIEHGTDWEDLGEDSPAGQLIEDLIEVTADWLEDDATRAVVYDGMVDTGPMLANVGKALARAARGERIEGDERDRSNGGGSSD